MQIYKPALEIIKEEAEISGVSRDEAIRQLFSRYVATGGKRIITITYEYQPYIEVYVRMSEQFHEAIDRGREMNTHTLTQIVNGMAWYLVPDELLEINF